MKHLALNKLAETVAGKRKALGISQTALSESTGINRSILSRLEAEDYTPSVDQLLALSEVLDFNYADLFEDDKIAVEAVERKKITVAGTGYVGLSLAVLLSQHNDVTAVDIVPEKVEKLNNWSSPIQDDYIEKYLAEHEERNLSFAATTDAESAYKDADFIIVAAPTNYDPKTNFFDCSAVESVLSLIKSVTESRENKPTIVIKSTIPVGYTMQVREKLGMDNIIFSPEFLRESKALYDNLYPSRIIVGSDENNMEQAEVFAALLRQGAVKTDIPMLFMATTEAEATKLFVNTYLALRVSYFNELDTYAEVKILIQQTLSRAYALTRVLAITTTIQALVTADIVCQRIQSSFLQTIRMFHRI